jgi:hypothetical protein
MIFGCTLTEGTAYSVLNFNAADTLQFTHVFASAVQWSLGTTQVFRDSSAWYHIVAVLDTGNATQADRVQLYVNGSRITSFASSTPAALNASSYINSTNFHAIGKYANSQYFDGYLTDVNFIDGQALTPASFGAINSSTGVWAPSQYTGTYGTNGFYLKFADASAATAAAIGKDSSPNGNNWTPNSISVTAGVTYDSMIDVPVNYSDGGNGRGNYAVLNPTLTNAGGASLSITGGNLNILRNASGYARGIGTLGMSSGKWYFEFTPTNNTTSQFIGVGQISGDINNYPGFESTSWGFNTSNGNKTNNAINTAYGAYAGGQTVGVAVDMNAGNIWFSVNGTWQASGNPETGANPAFSGLSGEVFPQIGLLNATTSAVANFGQRPFTYTPPAGFRALNTNNLPTPSIVNGANFMAATTYTGNAAARSLSNAVNNVSFQPDLVWIKSRTPGATSHALFNSVRLATKYLSSNTAGVEVTNANTLTAFGADGFSLGTDTTLVNAGANSYVAWQWKRAVSSGLDIVTYAGTLTGAGTVAINHNLGVAPKLVISKSLTPSGVDVGNWFVWHSSAGTDNFLRLNTPDQANSISGGGGGIMIAPTNSVFYTPYISGSNVTGNNYIAYCFSEILGFSKFSSYIGNGSTDGPFVFCGFRPRWIMLKSTSTNNWFIYDTSRGLINVLDDTDELYPNLSNAEPTTAAVNRLDILSNGFKVRAGSGINPNFSGQTYIFAAFAEVPSKYALAR